MYPIRDEGKLAPVSKVPRIELKLNVLDGGDLMIQTHLEEFIQ